MKNKRGSITLFVLFAGLFFIIFLSTTLMYSSIKRKTEEEMTKKTEELYGSKNETEVYQSYFGEGAVPIYTKEQLFKIGSGENVQIKEEGGKIYNFGTDCIYVLKNDLEFEYNGIWQMPEIAENGRIEGNGNQIKIKDTSKAEEVYYYYMQENQYKYPLTALKYSYKNLIIDFDGIQNTSRWTWYDYNNMARLKWKRK